jgi:hypothetical protein
MKAMPTVVIAVGVQGRHPSKGGAPVSSCGGHESMDNRGMIAVPLKALSMDSEDGKPVSPEVGDEVELPRVMGIVRKVDGEEAYVEIKEVGGMGVEYEEPKAQSEDEGESEGEGGSMAMEEGKLRKMAMEHDRMNGNM